MIWSVNNSISGQLDNNSAQKQINSSDLSSPKNKVPRFYTEEIQRGPSAIPPKLNASYNVENSMNEAYEKAIDFANRVLLDDESNMSLQFDDSGDLKAIVENIETKEVIQEYPALKVLQMYSGNYNLQGLVIDAVI